MNFSDPGQPPNVLAVLPGKLSQELDVSMRKFQVHG